jgi:cobalt-zinc-cadmium efflux system protein
MSEHEHHGHEHHQHHQNRKALLLALINTLFIMAVEIVGGILSGSLALISDAGHMLTDAGSLLLALLAAQFSRRPSTNKRTFGLYRLEILAALLNGVLLIFLSAYIIYEAMLRIYHPEPVKGILMMLVALIGLVSNLLSAYWLSDNKGTNLNIKGAFLHVVWDAVSSVGVIIAGLVIMFTGFTFVDPLVSFVICIFVLKGGFGLIQESVDILLESTPSDINIDDVKRAIKENSKEIKDVHDIHIWTITSGIRAMSAHVLVEDAKVSKCSGIAEITKAMLEQKFRITHTTLEFECDSCDKHSECAIAKQR